MNFGKISLGIITVFVGAVILLDNLNVISFDWLAIISLWPVIIILSGINTLLPKKMEGQILSIMATVVVVLLFAYQGLGSGLSFWKLKKEEEVSIESKNFSRLSRDYDTT